MHKIFKEMREKMIKTLARFNVFLSAFRTEPFFDEMAAIFAALIFPQLSVPTHNTISKRCLKM